jgi:hypothetical protein
MIIELGAQATAMVPQPLAAETFRRHGLPVADQVPAIVPQPAVTEAPEGARSAATPGWGRNDAAAWGCGETPQINEEAAGLRVAAMVPRSWSAESRQLAGADSDATDTAMVRGQELRRSTVQHGPCDTSRRRNSAAASGCGDITVGLTTEDSLNLPHWCRS